MFLIFQYYLKPSQRSFAFIASSDKSVCVSSVGLSSLQQVLSAMPTVLLCEYHSWQRPTRQIYLFVCLSDPIKLFRLTVWAVTRDRPDWYANFESLEIGAWVEIGVTMTGGLCQYFVNEITRTYEADFFAEWLSQPGTHICRAVAMALEGVFFSRPIRQPVGSLLNRTISDNVSRPV
jgi:hypothetical protein